MLELFLDNKHVDFKFGSHYINLTACNVNSMISVVNAFTYGTKRPKPTLQKANPERTLSKYAGLALDLLVWTQSKPRANTKTDHTFATA
jgi:hypothetical protein